MAEFCCRALAGTSVLGAVEPLSPGRLGGSFCRVPRTEARPLVFPCGGSEHSMWLESPGRVCLAQRALWLEAGGVSWRGTECLPPARLSCRDRLRFPLSVQGPSACL